MSENIISFEDWEKLDLRVAQIKKVEEIEGADKLYQLILDVGKAIGTRIVCAGIKPYYKKEELKGKKIILFANLKPRMMKGIESQGMLLAAGNKEENKIAFLTPEKDVANGVRVS